MILEFLYKGLILGVSVAAPIGPIGVICINRTINKDFASGIASGLGAATADLIYGFVAGFGLTTISSFLINQKNLIQLVGIVFLFYLGLRIMIKKENEISFNDETNKGLFKDYLSTFALTITNPMTILFFIAVFAGLGLSKTINGISSVTQLIIGVFTGSLIWWMFLCGLTFKLKARINKNIISRINLFSGITILIFGFVILIDLVKEIKWNSP